MTTPLRRLLQLADRILSTVLIGGVRLYQIFLSPIFGRQCRFWPTCSHYFIEAVRKYGAIPGAWRGVLRICRCHPWHPGGIDPP
jgi:putative membrane protein insertion efficiency factor